MVLRLLFHPLPILTPIAVLITCHILYRRLPDGIRVFKSPHSVTIPVLSRPTTNVLDSLRFTPETTMSQIKQAIGSSSKSTKHNGATKTSSAAKTSAAATTTRIGGRGNKAKGAAAAGGAAAAAGGSGTQSQPRPQSQTRSRAPGPVPGPTPGPTPRVNNAKDRKSQRQPK